MSSIVNSNGPVWNVREFGAMGDRSRLDTRAVQGAIDACAAAGGGVVYCPPGDYLIGSVELKTNVNLHLEAGATLWGSTDKADYDLSNKLPVTGARHAQLNSAHLVFARSAQNVAITGRGSIDGQGDTYFVSVPGSARLGLKGWRPERLIAFINCRNVLVEGVRLANSPGWMLWPLGCEQVRITGVRIETNPWGPNTDGIDPDCCRDVYISDCYIDAGDDCIALKSSANLLGDGRACENVTVTNCTMRTTCCAIRVGYEGDGPIRNCTFSNLVFFKTRTGINMLAPRDAANQIEHGPPIENISFSNIVMDTQIACYLWIGDDAAAPGRIRNVSLQGVRATTERAGYFGGSRSIPIENLRLSDIDLTVRGATNDEFAREVPYPYPVFDNWIKRGIPHALYCRHVRGLDMSDIRVRWSDASGPWGSALWCQHVSDLTLRGLNARQGPASDAPVVRLENVSRACLNSCRTEPGAGTFLRLAGPASGDVVAIGNHLADAAKPFDLADDLPPGAFTGQFNHMGQ